ncbi:YdcF family protein [Psychrobacter sp. I-STPA6b]|uniref:YdcF family protein n=1 Tax=Psychrobacter sp. I-STPA6b TaxID=2585718 RepID=UPI001D0C1CC2|nr:YdcF family protein [Psychrobacter sp. I-STPA6b]
MLFFKKLLRPRQEKLSFRQRVCRLCQFFIFLSLLFAVSFITPLFSKVGLFVLKNLPVPQAHSQNNKKDTDTAPTAYVLLGGGLTKGEGSSNNYSPNNSSKADIQQDKHNIVINDFTRQRLKTLLTYYHNKSLPIILSGVESPWMQDWLIEQGVSTDNIITENASMNTCENARFTAKRVAVQNVYLITDAYHMSRARRQFALNGVTTTPISAPLPSPAKWWQIQANMRHSRRTLYEIGAYLRDIIKPQDDCRHADDVSIQTLMQSRKPNSLKTF